jgi:hypothetical protein
MIGRTVYHPVHGSVTVCLCLVLWICMCTFVYLHFNVSEYSVGRLGFQVWGHQWVTLCVFECIWALRSLKECQISVHMCLFNNSMCVSLRMSVFCICVGVWVNLRLLFVFLIVSLWVPGFCVHVCVFVCRSALLCVHVCVCVCVCVCMYFYMYVFDFCASMCACLSSVHLLLPQGNHTLCCVCMCSPCCAWNMGLHKPVQKVCVWVLSWGWGWFYACTCACLSVYISPCECRYLCIPNQADVDSTTSMENSWGRVEKLGCALPTPLLSSWSPPGGPTSELKDIGWWVNFYDPCLWVGRFWVHRAVILRIRGGLSAKGHLGSGWVCEWDSPARLMDRAPVSWESTECEKLVEETLELELLSP